MWEVGSLVGGDAWMLVIGLFEPLYRFLAFPLENYAFMRRALLTSVLVGVVCSLLSSYIVLKGWSLIGDAMAHAVLPGIVIAYMFGFSLLLGAFISGVVASVAISFIDRNSPIKEDASIGIVFTGFFAFGVALLPIAIDYVARHGIHDQHIDVMHILFGNVLGVTTHDLIVTALTGLALVAIIIVFFKELMLYSFDPVQADVLGIPSQALHYVLMIMTAAAVVASLQTVGIALVIAMLIAPGATAFLLTDRLPQMMVVASLVGVFASITGMYVSFYWDLASGAVIVLVTMAAFVAAFLFSKRTGLLRRWWRRQARRRTLDEAKASGVEAPSGER